LKDISTQDEACGQNIGQLFFNNSRTLELGYLAHLLTQLLNSATVGW
jgi:hypothetical protein